MFLGVLSQCIGKKIPEMRQKWPFLHAGCHLRGKRPGAGENTAHLVTGRRPARVFRVQKTGGGCVFHSDTDLPGGTDKSFSCCVAFPIYLWHSIISMLSIPSSARQSRNNRFLDCCCNFKSNRELHWVVFLSWQRKNLIETISDLQMSEVNKTITTVFLTAVTN